MPVVSWFPKSDLTVRPVQYRRKTTTTRRQLNTTSTRLQQTRLNDVVRASSVATCSECRMNYGRRVDGQGMAIVQRWGLALISTVWHRMVQHAPRTVRGDWRNVACTSPHDSIAAVPFNLLLFGL